MSRKPSSSKAKRMRVEKMLATKMLRRLREGADVRARKVRRLGAAIRAGRYENGLKLHIAIDRAMEDVRARG